MSTCTTTPVPAAPARPDRRSHAEAIRTTLSEAAAAINAQHARVLSAVIAMKEANLHRSEFGFSALRDLLLSQFDFTYGTAGALAAIARLSGKFRLLAAAATTGAARVDQVAYAVRQLDQTPAMRPFARTPFRTPAPSPFDPEVQCATPEAMVAEFCQHATFKALQRHLDELWASIADEAELFDELGEQSLQRLELTETGNGMWHLDGDLSDATGRLLDKYLKTACPPPRQDEQDADEVLPPQANRHAEALHQLLAGYGTSKEAVTRHGHTATLDLVVDIETLRGEDTGRLPLLEGKPISVAKARLLACEAGVIPSVFDYAAGEAIELGRALRLPNVALRRKLEREQPEGCAWSGCGRPVAWTEAHHVRQWADGGATTAENLILLCRFHHGRIHTNGWSVAKTGPGRAVITHHDGHDTGAGVEGMDGNECGCADWRTDAALDIENQGSDWEVFPTGLYRSEWSEGMKSDLDGHAEMVERERSLTAIEEARAKARARFRTHEPPEPVAAFPANPSGAEPAPTPGGSLAPVGPVDYGEPPFLRGPFRWRPERGTECISGLQLESSAGSGPSPCPGQEAQPRPSTSPPDAKGAGRKPTNPPRLLPTSLSLPAQPRPSPNRTAEQPTPVILHLV
ncbi:MAG TPA: DUF222 domain-containing protein, partial [Glycomyces sp.]|nr:DUF222 domain-containing protein [Glycomyces sp.]